MKDPVLQSNEPLLRKIAKPVSKAQFGSKELHKIIAHMKRVLKHEQFGVAIAAPQIGESLRMFVIAEKAFGDSDEPSSADGHAEASEGDREQNSAKNAGLAHQFTPAHPGSSRREHSQTASQSPEHTVFINPEIIRVSKKKREMSEGCLSVRGKYGTVMRHEKASVKAYDEHGKAFTYQGSGLIAHIFQHEIDHLEGVLYTDKAKKLTHEEEREDLREQYPA